MEQSIGLAAESIMLKEGCFLSVMRAIRFNPWKKMPLRDNEEY